ncbi:MAG: DedA family protein [Campylobacterales bacterium]|nr:DedA family protein [Campylobacterales bacterium]
MPFINALLFASLGNVLAIFFNYYLGYYFFLKTQEKLLSSRFGKKAYELGHRYGYWALLLSWLPLIGDPLTVVAGVLRLRFVWFVVIAGTLRVLRYLVLGLMV